MTTAQLRPIAPQKLHFSENLSVWVSDAQCRLVVSQPALDPTLWNTYLQGALRAYSKHGVECTLDLDAISDGSDTQLFFAAIDIGGDVVGGARVIGPLRSADDSHAVVEWAGNPGLSAVRKMINDRAPFGVVEVKSGWVNSDAQRSDAIAAALARPTAKHVPVGGSVCDGDRGGPRAGPVAFFGGSNSSENPGGSIPGRALPDQDDLVGPQNLG